MAPLVILFLSPCAVLLPALSIIFWHKKDCGLASRHRVYYVWTGSWNKGESISYQTTLLCIWVETTMTFEHFWLIKKVSDCKTETEINFGLVIMTFFFLRCKQIKVEILNVTEYGLPNDFLLEQCWVGKLPHVFFFFGGGLAESSTALNIKETSQVWEATGLHPSFFPTRKIQQQ